jgi:hypothetical protein
MINAALWDSGSTGARALSRPCDETRVQPLFQPFFHLLRPRRLALGVSPVPDTLYGSDTRPRMVPRGD